MTSEDREMFQELLQQQSEIIAVMTEVIQLMKEVRDRPNAITIVSPPQNPTVTQPPQYPPGYYPPYYTTTIMGVGGTSQAASGEMFDMQVSNSMGSIGSAGYQSYR